MLVDLAFHHQISASSKYLNKQHHQSSFPWHYELQEILLKKKKNIGVFEQQWRQWFGKWCTYWVEPGVSTRRQCGLMLSAETLLNLLCDLNVSKTHFQQTQIWKSLHMAPVLMVWLNMITITIINCTQTNKYWNKQEHFQWQEKDCDSLERFQFSAWIGPKMWSDLHRSHKYKHTVLKLRPVGSGLSHKHSYSGFYLVQLWKPLSAAGKGERTFELGVNNNYLHR